MRMALFPKTPFIAVLICIISVLSFAPVRAEETIKIASIYAHTGVAVKSNEPSVMGVRLGVQEINSRGGLLGKKLELIEIDNMSTPIGSKVAAVKAVRANVTAIIGAAWSSHSIAIARVAQANKIPMISNISTNPDVTKIGDYIFRVCFTDSFQGRVMATFARKDLNAATAVIFVDMTSNYSKGLAEEFLKNFEKMGGTVLLQFHYRQKQENFRYSISRAKDLAPDVLFIPGYDESGLIIKEAVKAGLNAIPLGGDGWGDIESFFLIGWESKEGYYSTHWMENIESDLSRNFVKKYGQADDHIHAAAPLGYDAVLVLADAIRRAGSTDRAKIRDALAKTSNFQGVTGIISFNTQGDPIKNAVIMKITDGRSYYLKSVQP